MTRKDFVNKFLQYLYDYPLFDDFDHRRKQVIAEDMAWIAEKHMVPKKNFIPYTEELASITEEGVFEEGKFGIYLNKWELEDE